MRRAVSFFRTVAPALIVGAFASCSSLHPFKSTGPENMNITTDAHSVSVRMDVYSVDAKCEASYQGTVDLSDHRVNTGIPANNLAYLEFSFSGGNYFTGSHTTDYGLYLTPRPGYRYDVAVSYAAAMYGVTIYEQDAHGTRRKIPFTGNTCPAKGA